jgi:F-type H+-transporting ATPase subunit b
LPNEISAKPKMFMVRNLNFTVQSRLIIPSAVFATHSPLCPTKKMKNKESLCPGSKGGGSGGGQGINTGKLVRAAKSGKVRLAFIPEEWFLFFYSKTGVTGPYIFGIVLANYLMSKEKFIMEHEYYLGLSWLVVMSCAVKFLGPGLSSWLDKEVDDVSALHEKGRKDEMKYYEDIIKTAKDAQFRAEGQKVLIEAKKENIAMQLEAIYRERCMLVYKSVKGRMDYHVKRYHAEARIHQKWMIGWILQNVRKSITPDFEKQALNAAIQELASMSGRAK